MKTNAAVLGERERPGAYAETKPLVIEELEQVNEGFDARDRAEVVRQVIRFKAA
ncbi:MAG: hypothetical protein ACREH8_17220 [Opitutaceae bacterium]